MKRARSARSGRFVTKLFAKLNPATTVEETADGRKPFGVRAVFHDGTDEELEPRFSHRDEDGIHVYVVAPTRSDIREVTVAVFPGRTMLQVDLPGDR